MLRLRATDTFDTLTHARPYKPPRTPKQAIDEIVRCRGSHFDPAVADALEAIAQRVGPAQLPELVDPVDPWRDSSPLDSGDGGGGWAWVH